MNTDIIIDALTEKIESLNVTIKAHDQNMLLLP